MGKKLTYEYVYNYFKEQGCELLETKYINSNTKMKYICSCNNESKIRLNDFKKGYRCFKCSGSAKHSYEYVYNYFKEQGCELLETEYLGNKNNMNYICTCGNKSQINFNSFQQGRRCMNCSGTPKYTYEYVYNYFKERGCELLEKEYIGAQTKMKYICSCNNESKIRFNDFRRNVRCRNCFSKNISGENHTRWKKDRTRKIRASYLSFSHKKFYILKDDPNYKNYIKSQKEAKNNNYIWNRNRSKFSVDHIFPRVAFIDNDLDKIYDIKIIKEICNCRENLQILESSENIKKHAKYNQEEFMAWFNNKIKEYNFVCK